MKNFVSLVCLGFLTIWVSFAQIGSAKEKKVGLVLNNWHKAASEANFDNYFSYMTDDSIFIGTDATENWSYHAFREFSKPYFDRGKAWSYTVLERNIFFSDSGKIAWFDELLDTQMKICRGSGVLEQQKDGSWKIAHYVLSIAVPNENVGELIALKAKKDSVLTKMLKEKQE